MSDDIFSLSAVELAGRIRSKQVSSVDAVKVFLGRIEKIEPKIKAFVKLMGNEAIESAKKIDEKIARGENAGSLAGVPIAVKDNMMVMGVQTTCSSKILKDYIAPYDATIIEKLRSEGAVFLGKTNLDEFAMGSSTENSAFEVTRNPWDTSRIPGGSSGGSAASVAARMAPLALGSDTGGSIRQPASCCGVVGLKPTYGRVSRYGLVAFASSLDQIGPFAGNVEDAAALLQAMAGHDPKDSTSADIAVPDYVSSIKKEIRGLKIGLPEEYFSKGLDKGVENAVREAVKVLEKLGCVIKKISLPHTEYAVAVYYIIAPCEASANLARYDGVRYGFRAECSDLLEEYEKTRGEGFGPEVKRRIMLGTYALSAGYYDAYYGKAQRVRTLVSRDFEQAFKEVDVIAAPTAPTSAFKIGEKAQDPLQMYLSDIYTISSNLAGIPALSVPCGFTPDNLPVGLQLMGRPFDEETVLRAGYAYEKNTEWSEEHPNV